MSKLHRIAWIDVQIRAGRYPNANRVASRFEISRRQAARDIEYLRHSMGAPLEYSAKQRGYFYSDQAYALPSLLVSDSELSALSYLAERYGSIDGEAAGRVAGVLRRLASRTIPDRGPDSEPPAPGVDSLELRALDHLRLAIEDRRVVLVRYRGADGQVVIRTLSPYALVTRLGALSCVAYCEETGVTTIFPLARLEAIEYTEVHFQPPRRLDLNEWSDDGRPLEPEPFVAKVKLGNPEEAEHLEGAEFREEGILDLPFYDSAAVLAKLLACRSGFEIVAPAWLRRKLRRHLEDLIQSNT